MRGAAVDRAGTVPGIRRRHSGPDADSFRCGDVYALVEYPFPRVKAALDKSEDWCDVLILHLNVKQCRTAGGPSFSALVIYIGTKHAQRPATASRIDFNFRVLANLAQ